MSTMRQDTERPHQHTRMLVIIAVLCVFSIYVNIRQQEIIQHYRHALDTEEVTEDDEDDSPEPEKVLRGIRTNGNSISVAEPEESTTLETNEQDEDYGPSDLLKKDDSQEDSKKEFGVPGMPDRDYGSDTDDGKDYDYEDTKMVDRQYGDENLDDSDYQTQKLARDFTEDVSSVERHSNEKPSEYEMKFAMDQTGLSVFAKFLLENGLDAIEDSPVETPGYNLKPCEDDCTWFKDIKKGLDPNQLSAAIYYLTKRVRLNNLMESLALLYNNFNHKYEYPVIIFHEAELVPHLEQIRNSTNNFVFFQQVEFEIPEFLSKEVPDSIPCKSAIGYRHMSRFQAKLVYEYAFIQEFDYLLRLDDDTLITHSIDYDIFEYMNDNGLQYGYRVIHYDLDKCTTGLWEAASFFINMTGIRPHFLDTWNHNRIFYNNFELSKRSLWMSPEYQLYVNFIDRLGGIYYHRWGDAPIKSLAVAMLLDQSQTHVFENVGYKHGKKKVLGPQWPKTR